MNEKQYIYTFKINDKEDKIDVRNISESHLKWCLQIIKFPEFEHLHNYQVTKKLLTEHFPELLI